MPDDATGSPTDDATGSPPDDEPEPASVPEPGGDAAHRRELRRMRRAIKLIRREGWKVAVISATLDAALATLLVNLTFRLLPPGWLPVVVPLPPTVVGVLRRYAGVSLADPTLSGAAVAGIAAGAAVFAVGVALRIRRPLVEQFEAANPGLAEALRTARDAVEDGRQTVIARRLYEDVLDGLRAASSIGLLDLRRVAATAVVVILLSLATVQVAVVDLTVPGLDGGAGGEPPGGGVEEVDYEGLQDPTDVLGEPEDVPAGVENLNATIGTAGGGGEDPTEPVPAYADSGYADDDVVESQRASFAGREQVEEAELIREYTLRIREVEDA